MPAPLPFEKRVKAAGITLTFATACFEIWWLYRNQDTRQRYLQGMDHFSEFFRYDEEAHWRAAVIGVCTLFDSRSDTVTLQALVTESAATGDVSAIRTKAIKAIRTKLKRLEPFVKKVKVLRHKLFAHRDHAIEYSGAYQAAQLSPDALRSLLSGSLTILNEVAALHGLTKVETSPFVMRDTERLLKTIQPE